MPNSIPSMIKLSVSTFSLLSRAINSLSVKLPPIPRYNLFSPVSLLTFFPKSLLFKSKMPVASNCALLNLSNIFMFSKSFLIRFNRDRLFVLDPLLRTIRARLIICKGSTILPTACSKLFPFLSPSVLTVTRSCLVYFDKVTPHVIPDVFREKA